MRDIFKNKVKNCVVLTNLEFNGIMAELFGQECEVEYTYDGIWYGNGDSEIPIEEIHEKIAEYLEVAKVTSIHMDDEEYPIGIWIVYE